MFTQSNFEFNLEFKIWYIAKTHLNAQPDFKPDFKFKIKIWLRKHIFKIRLRLVTLGWPDILLKSGYVIQLTAFRWDTACIRSSPDPSLEVDSACEYQARTKQFPSVCWKIVWEQEYARGAVADK